MPPAVSRFGPPLGSGPFSHIPQSHLQHQNQQHQPPGSGGLPPPSYNPHHAFTPGNPSSNISPFSPTTNGNGLAGGFGTGNGLSSAGTGLGSHAAQMGFAHGAALQQQQQAREANRRSSGGASGGKGQMKGRIRDVWRNNLAQEMQILRGLVDKYSYISMVRRESSVGQYLLITSTDDHCRTLNFPVSLLDPWGPLQPKRIIIIKPSGVMSISYG